MKILITGGAGYLGSALTGYMLDKAHQVVVLDRLFFDQNALHPFLENQNFSLLNGDIRDEKIVKLACKEADAVIHLAALVGEEACRVNEAATKAINFEATRNLFHTARDCGMAHFIFASTCSNYGASGSVSSADETSELVPLSLYAETKVNAEKFLLGQKKQHPSVTILRFATLCGVSNRMRFDLLVNEMARASAMKEVIHIYSPEAWRPFLHVRDAARAVEQVLNADKNLICNQVYNMVGENFQKRELVEMVCRNFPDSRIRLEEGKPDPRDYRVTSNKISNLLGIQAKCTIEEAFAEVVKLTSSGAIIDPILPKFRAVPSRNDLKWRTETLSLS